MVLAALAPDVQWVEFMAQGDTVVALGEYSATFKATGKSFRAPFAYVWKLVGGKVKSFPAAR